MESSCRRWNDLKRRLGLKGMGCCGAIWRPGTRTITNNIIIQEEGEEEEADRRRNSNIEHVINSAPAAASGMNLAMALAAERNSRDGGPAVEDGGNVKSLMTLIEETDGVDWGKKKCDVATAGGGGVNDWMCCVCMDRNKGAAFIPCGHSFCRVCSKELWLNRSSCPICNRSILQILDIF